MKRLVFLILVCLAFSASIFAQSGLAINTIFNGSFVNDPAVAQTYMSGKSKFLRTHHLDVLATFKAPASQYASIVEKLVKEDAGRAVGKNVRYKNGKLFFALYTFPPVVVDGKKRNRFVYYYNAAAGKGKIVSLIYMEGTLDEEEANNLIFDLQYNRISKC